VKEQASQALERSTLLEQGILRSIIRTLLRLTALSRAPSAVMFAFQAWLNLELLTLTAAMLQKMARVIMFQQGQPLAELALSLLANLLLSRASLPITQLAA
jgi:hypothetical protein